MIEVDAPVNRMPLFVEAGSILPMGAQVKHGAEAGDRKHPRLSRRQCALHTL